jgi:hypothetical protein
VSQNNRCVLRQNVLEKTARRDKRAQSVLLTPSSTSQGFSRAQIANRGQSIDTYTRAVIKPKVLESKVSNQEKFFNLSGGFQKVFSNDFKDQKMVVPVVGYGGHRRGESS